MYLAQYKLKVEPDQVTQFLKSKGYPQRTETGEGTEVYNWIGNKTSEQYNFSGFVHLNDLIYLFKQNSSENPIIEWVEYANQDEPYLVGLLHMGFAPCGIFMPMYKSHQSLYYFSDIIGCSDEDGSMQCYFPLIDRPHLELLDELIKADMIEFAHAANFEVFEKGSEKLVLKPSAKVTIEGLKSLSSQFDELVKLLNAKDSENIAIQWKIHQLEAALEALRVEILETAREGDISNISYFIVKHEFDNIIRNILMTLSHVFSCLDSDVYQDLGKTQLATVKMQTADNLITMMRLVGDWYHWYIKPNQE